MDRLTDDILFRIFSNLDELHDKYMASCVSKRWNNIIEHSLRVPRPQLKFVPQYDQVYWLEIDHIPFKISTSVNASKSSLTVQKFLYQIPDHKMSLKMCGTSVAMLDVSRMCENIQDILDLVKLFTNIHTIHMTGRELDFYLVDLLPPTISTMINVDPAICDLDELAGELKQLVLVNPRRYYDLETILDAQPSLQSISVTPNNLFKFRALFNMGELDRSYESLRELWIADQIMDIQFSRDILPVLHLLPNLEKLECWFYNFKDPLNTEFLPNLQHHENLRVLIIHRMIATNFQNITRFFRKLPNNLTLFACDVGDLKPLLSHMFIEYLSNAAGVRAINIVRDSDTIDAGPNACDSWNHDKHHDAMIMLTDASYSHPVRRIKRNAIAAHHLERSESLSTWKQPPKVKVCSGTNTFKSCLLQPRYFWYSSLDSAIRYTEWRTRTILTEEEFAPVVSYLAKNPQKLTHVLPTWT